MTSVCRPGTSKGRSSSSFERRASGLALALALCAGAAACAEGAPQPPLTRQVTVWNRCTTNPDEPNFYALQELYTHTTPSWSGETDLLDNDLEVGAETVVSIRDGSYVTVVRRRNLGQRIALTTSTPLNLGQSCNLLEVFDDGFRLTQDLTRCFDRDDGPPGGDPAPGD